MNNRNTYIDRNGERLDTGLFITYIDKTGEIIKINGKKYVDFDGVLMAVDLLTKENIIIIKN